MLEVIIKFFNNGKFLIELFCICATENQQNARFLLEFCCSKTINEAKVGTLIVTKYWKKSSVENKFIIDPRYTPFFCETFFRLHKTIN